MTELDPKRMAYSIREVSVALGISERAVHRMIERGKLKAVDIGGRKFVSVSLLRVLLAGS